MPWRVNDDKNQISGDIPGTRRALLDVATKPKIFFFMLMAVIGGALFIVGLIGLAQNKTLWIRIDDIPKPILWMVVGFMAFMMFFPMFIALYFVRHLLRSVMHLEHEVAAIKGAIESQQAGKSGLRQ